MNKLFKYWLSKEIPDHYLNIKITGRGFVSDTKSLVLFYLIHPVKRRIAKYYCILLKKFFKLKVIAITGSSGKSTTKEMLSSILKLDGNTVFSYANIDPIYNIPSTILKCKLNTKYLVLEFGVEYPGEMDFYLWMVEPDIGIITSINPTHLEFFKSVDGVFKEKIKLAKYLLENSGKVILNFENKYLKKYGLNKRGIYYYGDGSNIYAANIRFKGAKTFFDIYQENCKLSIDLSVPGKINVENALASFTAAIKMGIDTDKIKRALKTYKPLEHRLSILNIKNSIIIDDSYNNNPVAAKRAIEFLKDYAKDKEKVVVFGDMLELGKDSLKYHLEIAEILSDLSLKRLVCVGSESRVITDYVRKKIETNKAYWVLKENAVDKFVLDLLNENCVILIKASRSIGLDRLVGRLSK